MHVQRIDTKQNNSELLKVNTKRTKKNVTYSIMCNYKILLPTKS